jgi:hypothetical protein
MMGSHACVAFRTELLNRTYLKIVVYVQGQGVDLILKRSVHAVGKLLKSNRNAAIGRKMHF